MRLRTEFLLYLTALIHASEISDKLVLENVMKYAAPHIKVAIMVFTIRPALISCTMHKNLWHGRKRSNMITSRSGASHEGLLMQLDMFTSVIRAENPATYSCITGPSSPKLKVIEG